MLNRLIKNKKIAIGALVSLPFLVLIGLAGFYQFRYSADEAKIGVGVTLPGSVTGGQSYSYPEYIRGLYAFSMKVAVALCTLMIIYAGYKYLTSKGDSGSINEAKDILFSTLMGAALLILVVLVGEISGFDTTTWGI
jgi:hypothetical protein